MKLRRVRWMPLPVLVIVAALGAASAQAAQFAGKPALVEADAYCVTAGEDKGRVFVEIAARYPDAPKAKGKARHDVGSMLHVLGPMGGILGTHSDDGRAQVDIPRISSYVHTHQHRLGKAASSRVLGGKPCSRGTVVPIRIKTTLRQELLSPAGGKASASALEGQSTQASAAATVTGVAAAPSVTNGCVYDAVGLMDCYGAFLQKANFSGLDIAYANFAFANLLGADFRETRMGHAQMNQAVLDQADLSGAELGVATLTSASMIETDLSGAKAPYANLAVAKLAEADLTGANLTGANLAETRFENGNRCDAQTVLPGIFGFGCIDGVIQKR